MCLRVPARGGVKCVKGDGEHRSRIEMASQRGHARGGLPNPGLIGHGSCFTTELEKVKFLLLILKSASGTLAE